MIQRLEPRFRLCAGTLGPGACFRFCISLSLPLPRSCSVSVSQKQVNRKEKKRKEKKRKEKKRKEKKKQKLPALAATGRLVGVRQNRTQIRWEGVVVMQVDVMAVETEKGGRILGCTWGVRST